MVRSPPSTPPRASETASNPNNDPSTHVKSTVAGSFVKNNGEGGDIACTRHDDSAVDGSPPVYEVVLHPRSPRAKAIKQRL